MKKLNHQVNIRLTEEEVKTIDTINQTSFGGEANYAMICRYLIKEGLKNLNGKK